jgi:hypothetical protein
MRGLGDETHRHTSSVVSDGSMACRVARSPDADRVVEVSMVMFVLLSSIQFECEPSGRILFGIQQPGMAISSHVDGAMAGLSCSWQVIQ